MRVLAIVVLCACASPERVDDPARPTGMGASTETLALAKTTPPALPAAPTAPPAEVASCVDEPAYDAATLRARVSFLASPALDGRAPGSEGDRTARALIAERFACLGLTPAFGGSFEQPFTEDGKDTANLVGYLPGSDPTVASELVMIAAHHDHLGGGYLGANDNASGVVALLAVAQAIRQLPTAPRRTLVFATFGAEETGMHGSYFYARHAPAELPIERMVQVINLDMVGSHSSRGFVTAMGTFKRLAATKLLAPLLGRYKRLSVPMGGRARGSDFEPFCKLGVPYVFFWTPDRRCYHSTCDTAERLDYPRMLDIAKLAGDLTITMADTELDLAAARQRYGCGLPR